MAIPTDMIFRVYGIAAYIDNSWGPFDVTIQRNITIDPFPTESLANSSQFEIDMPGHLFTMFTQLTTRVHPKFAAFTKDLSDGVISFGGHVTYSDGSHKNFLVQHYHQSNITTLIGESTVFTDMVKLNKPLISNALGNVNLTLATGPTFTSTSFDNLTATGISVPFTTTTTVFGGGDALQAAISAAASNTRIVIVDSLSYNPIVINGSNNLSIEADVDQTPIIQRPAPASFPGVLPGWAMLIGGAVSGLAIRGITFLGNGNRNSFSSSDDGMIVSRNDSAPTPLVSLNNLIIEDCTFRETSASPTNGTCGILLASNSDGTQHTNVWIHRCFFDTNAAGSLTTGNNYGACTVVGFGNVYIQNCSVVRTNSLVNRATSNMRGYVYKNLSTVIEDCLAWDLGTGGSCEGFKHVNTTINNFGTAVGNDTIRNCVAYDCHRAFRNDLSGAAATITTSTCHIDTTGIADTGNGSIQLSAGASMTFRNNILLGAGDGKAFQSSSIVEDHNDVFGFAVLGKTLDASDLTITTTFKDVPNKNWTAQAAATKTGASDGGAQGVRYLSSGEQIVWITA